MIKASIFICSSLWPSKTKGIGSSWTRRLSGATHPRDPNVPVRLGSDTQFLEWRKSVSLMRKCSLFVSMQEIRKLSGCKLRWILLRPWRKLTASLDWRRISFGCKLRRIEEKKLVFFSDEVFLFGSMISATEHSHNSNAKYLGTINDYNYSNSNNS